MDKHPERIRSMFDAVAATYRVMNRLITFGGDARVRGLAVRLARLTPGRTLLDVATGTGDIIETALATQPQVHATGVDVSAPMLLRAQRRARLSSVRFVQADALALPFGDATFDRVTSGYLIRNVSDVEACFAEQFRVLQPGGRVVCVETTPPVGPGAPVDSCTSAVFRAVVGSADLTRTRGVSLPAGVDTTVQTAAGGNTDHGACWVPPSRCQKGVAGNDRDPQRDQAAMKLQHWIEAARPRTLPASVAPLLVASGYAILRGTFVLGPVIIALGVSILLQIGVNLANDYFDHIKGHDTAERTGPRRAAASGLIPARQVLGATLGVLAAAAVLIALLVIRAGAPILIAGIAALLAALAYSGRALSAGLPRFGRAVRLDLLRTGGGDRFLLRAGAQC